MLEGIDIEAMGSGMAKGLREQIARDCAAARAGTILAALPPSVMTP